MEFIKKFNRLQGVQLGMGMRFSFNEIKIEVTKWGICNYLYLDGILIGLVDKKLIITDGDNSWRLKEEY